MASSNSIKILEIARVSPSSNSSNSPTEFSLPLTFLDTYWFKFPPTERIIFYQLTEPKPFFNSVILPKLKRALSLTLFHYLPLAGHLTWNSNSPKPIILYAPNDAVSLTIAESTADLIRLSDNGIREATESHPFVPELYISDHKASIMSLQITLFPGQGFSIGITSHHGVVDGQTLSMFIKSWAHICKQEVQGGISLPQELTPFFDRSVINDPTGLDIVLLNWWLAYTKADSNPNKRNLKVLQTLGLDPNLVRATFDLSREDIKKLREKVKNDLVQHSTSKPIACHHLSAFVLTYAYVFVCMVKARSGGGDSKRSVCIAFTANYRTRLDPPIPENYFGNCVCGQQSFAKAEDYMEENGVAKVAEKISDMILGLDMSVPETSEEQLSTFMEMEPGTQVVSVSGSPRFGLYGSDFGWGRPKKVEIVSIDRTGAISMSESGDGSGGVEVGLSLSRHEMQIFTSLFVNGLRDL